MSARDVLITGLSALFFTPVVLFCVSLASAQVMGSTNYRIESDSINFAGGFSSSTNYVLESTAGEVATGDSDSTNYGIRAGYQQMVQSYISLSTPANVTMTPPLGGVVGGTSNGSTTVTVTTDSSAGYSLTISAENSPAMSNGVETIADYIPVGAPDFSFTTDASEAHFGYSPSGVDVVSRFLDNGTTLCNTGSSETLLACWDGLDTGGETISQGSSANNPAGATTTIYFRVGVGNTSVPAVGTYTATTTLTALAL